MKPKKPSTKFRRLEDGEWSGLIRSQADGTYAHVLKCCDCGLVHIVHEKVTKAGLRFRAWRKK